MADLAPGDVLADRFEVIGPLGRGGMATVYLAHDTVRNDKVAVKVLHDHLAHDPSMRRRLRREVRAASLVRHEAALVAHDLHPVGDTLALSMPFHGGATLTEHVRTHGALSDDQLRAVGARIAGALSDAHRQGVLHRDVTPNNVMLTAADDAVLTDFGLARTTDDHTATATSVMGTPGYAAPETYHGQRTDPRSDLYSLGAVLYFAATGRSPYGSGAPAAILQAQVATEPDPVQALRPELPTDLAATIDALLHRDPDHRPPGADEVARALADRRAAVIPEVPDTWNPEEEPLLPREEPPPLPTPNELPAGEWEVVLKGRRGCDAETLADHVGRVVGLPEGALEVTRPMRTRSKKFVLTRPTDKATADQLAEAGRLAGYRARLYDRSAPNTLQRLANLLPMLIAILWVAFPFFTLPTLGLELALVLSIGATILIPGIVSALGKAEPDDDLPLALTADLSHHLVGSDPPQGDADDFIDRLGLPSFLQDIAHEIASDVDIRAFAENLGQSFGPRRRGHRRGRHRGPPWMRGAQQQADQPPRRQASTTPAKAVEASKASTTTGASQAAAAPAAPPRPSRAEDLRGRALGNLDLLRVSLADGGEHLPDLARDDLVRTASSLRERAVDIARTAVGLEAALASTPEPDDVSWIHGRLTRLETLERTGEAVDEAERATLRAALQSADDAATARDDLESRLTSCLAQLLEVSALATRARAELHTGADVPATASDLRQQLDQQVEAVDAMRQEMGRRRKAARAAHAARERGG